MSDDVTVPFDENSSDNAVLLLAAVEELGLDPHVVRTSEGSFVVPQAVYDTAFGPRPKEKSTPARKRTTSRKAR